MIEENIGVANTNVPWGNYETQSMTELNTLSKSVGFAPYQWEYGKEEIDTYNRFVDNGLIPYSGLSISTYSICTPLVAVLTIDQYSVNNGQDFSLENVEQDMKLIENTMKGKMGYETVYLNNDGQIQAVCNKIEHKHLPQRTY